MSLLLFGKVHLLGGRLWPSSFPIKMLIYAVCEWASMPHWCGAECANLIGHVGHFGFQNAHSTAFSHFISYHGTQARSCATLPDSKCMRVPRWRRPVLFVLPLICSEAQHFSKYLLQREMVLNSSRVDALALTQPMQGFGPSFAY